MPKLTLPRLVIAITFIALFAMAVRVSFDTDTWWHLRAGQWIVEHQAIPQTDPFSHTRTGADWQYMAWIVQVPMYWLFTTFGYAGLNLFTAGWVTLTFVFVYLTCSGHPLLRAFTLVLAAAASAVYWAARPHIVSFALAGVFAYILWLYRWRQINRLWLLPLLMAFWANAHGGFAIGFILIALTLAGQTLAWLWQLFRQHALQQPAAPAPGDTGGRGLFWLAGIGLACALGVMLNPAGPVMLLYPFKTVSINTLTNFIQEWQSPNFHLKEAQPFLWLFFAAFGAAAFGRRRLNLTDLLLVGGIAYTGFLAGRNVALLAVVAPAFITQQMEAGWQAWRETYPRLGEIFRLSSAPPRGPWRLINWGLLGVIALAALVKIYIPLQPAINTEQLKRTSPVDAAEYIRQTRPPGALFNSYNYGGYLLWALPEYPVYVDGRTDLYPDEFLREYIEVSRGRPGYETVLDRYGIQLVLIESNSLLGDRLTENPLWRQTYTDNLAAVYERVAPVP